MTYVTISILDWTIGDDLKIEQITPNFSTSSVSGRVQVYERGCHFVKVEFSIFLSTDQDVKKFNALMLRLRGKANPFYLDLGTDSTYFNPLTSAARNITLASSTAIGQHTITVIGNTKNIQPGEYFTLPNDNKLYMVIAKNDQTLECYPSLMINHLAGEQLEFANPMPLLRLSEDNYIIEMQKGKSVTLKAIEVLL